MSVTLGAPPPAGEFRRRGRRGGLKRGIPADRWADASSAKNAGVASIATAQRRCITHAGSNLIYRGGGPRHVLGGEDQWER
jgi:hypothetical protein